MTRTPNDRAKRRHGRSDGSQPTAQRGMAAMLALLAALTLVLLPVHARAAASHRGTATQESASATASTGSGVVDTAPSSAQTGLPLPAGIGAAAQDFLGRLQHTNTLRDPATLSKAGPHQVRDCAKQASTPGLAGSLPLCLRALAPAPSPAWSGRLQHGPAAAGQPGASSLAGACRPAPNSDDRCWSWSSTYADSTMPAGALAVPMGMALSPSGDRAYMSGYVTDPANAVLRWVTVAEDTTTGDQLWATAYDGPPNLSLLQSGWPYAIAVSPDGSRVFVTGWSVTAPAEDMTINFSGALTTIAYDAASGRQLWVSNYESPLHGGQGLAIAVSPDGASVYVTGAIYQGFKPFVIGGTALYSGVTIAYGATTGTEHWIAPFTDSTGLAIPLAIAVAPDASAVYITGVAGYRTDIGFGLATLAYATGIGAAAGGTQLWEQTALPPGARAYDIGFDVTVSPSTGAVVITGTSYDLAGYSDFMTIAYRPQDGSRVWSSLYAGPEQSSTAVALVMDPTGSRVYVSGDTLDANLNQDYATVAYDAATGGQAWVATHVQGFDYLTSTALGDAAVYVTGLNIDNSGEPTQLTVAFAPDSGNELWSSQVNPSGADAVGNSGGLAVTAHGGGAYTTAALTFSPTLPTGFLDLGYGPGATASPATSVATVHAVPQICRPWASTGAAPAAPDTDAALLGSAALSGTDAWAVGGFIADTGGASADIEQLAIQPLAEKWNGTSWAVVPVPAPPGFALNVLESVSADASNDVWATGFSLGTLGGGAGSPLMQSVPVPLVEHWNGIAWHTIPAPEATGSLNGVEALSPTDVWAVGSTLSATRTASPPHPLLEHWDGTSWQAVAAPAGLAPAVLTAVSAASTSDAWAVGYGVNDNGGPNGTLITLHWNGSGWTSVPAVQQAPTDQSVPQFNAVLAVRSDDVWTAGANVLEHWNGSAWQMVTGPPVGQFFTSYEGLSATGADDVWLVGIRGGGFYGNDVVGGWRQPLTEHWNGERWTLLTDSGPTINNTLYAVASPAPGTAMGAGLLESFASSSYLSPFAQQFTPTPPGSALCVSAMADAGAVDAGSPLSYHVTVYNVAAQQTSQINLQATLPTGTEVLSATPSQGSCTTAPLVCELGTVSGLTTASIDVTVVAPQPETLSAVFAASTPGAATAQVSTPVTVQPATLPPATVPEGWPALLAVCGWVFSAFISRSVWHRRRRDARGAPS